MKELLITEIRPPGILTRWQSNMQCVRTYKAGKAEKQASPFTLKITYIGKFSQFTMILPSPRLAI